MASPLQRAVFNSVRAKLLLYRRPGADAAVIQTDEQMLLAQECVANLRRILLEARKVHSRQDYARMA
jgi:hypothetical protein